MTNAEYEKRVRKLVAEMFEITVRDLKMENEPRYRLIYRDQAKSWLNRTNDKPFSLKWCSNLLGMSVAKVRRCLMSHYTEDKDGSDK